MRITTAVFGSAIVATAGCALDGATALQRPPAPGQAVQALSATDGVRLSADGQSFVLDPSGAPFVPVGFNYTNPGDGSLLLEELWDDQWATVAADFQEMKQLGANVVRIHLQLGKFLDGPNQVNAHAIERLQAVVALAESTDLYLDITGLNAYRASDDPAWYLALDEAARWQAQAVFWEAVAEAVAGSPAVFCYDLMNEPVVTSGVFDDWTPGEFGGFSFVQRLTLDLGEREGGAVARAWITQMTGAIRRHDPDHLISVGLIAFRGGSFSPTNVADLLDFMAIHIYPESGNLEDAYRSVDFYDVGKPLVIEETFNIHCSDRELEWFLRGVRDRADGFVGHYFGRLPSEPAETIAQVVQRDGIRVFERNAAKLKAPAPFRVTVVEYWNASTRDHFFTTKRNDALLSALGYSYGRDIGELWWSDPGGGTPLCGHLDWTLLHHFLSADCAVDAEHQGHDLQFDEVLGWVVDGDVDAAPLHRYQSTATGDNYYFAQRNDFAFAFFGYAYAGSEGNVYP